HPGTLFSRRGPGQTRAGALLRLLRIAAAAPAQGRRARPEAVPARREGQPGSHLATPRGTDHGRARREVARGHPAQEGQAARHRRPGRLRRIGGETRTARPLLQVHDQRAGQPGPYHHPHRGDARAVRTGDRGPPERRFRRGREHHPGAADRDRLGAEARDRGDEDAGDLARFDVARAEHHRPGAGGRRSLPGARCGADRRRHRRGFAAAPAGQAWQREWAVKTILLVDDEYAVVEILATLLADEGYAVLTASDGQRALEILAEKIP